MITDCYIKGRFDNGVGKCAVVIAEGVPKSEERKVLHQVAWIVPAQWEYKGKVIVADQYNCEILAATYALQWCMEHDKQLVNIYANTTTAQSWYCLQRFPEGRVMGACYSDMVLKYYEHMNAKDGKEMKERLYADYIPKKDENEFNVLVNEIATKVK